MTPAEQKQLAAVVAELGALPMPVGLRRFLAVAEAFRYQDATTGLMHDHIRFPKGTAPTPFGCRWCGTEQGGHGRRYMRGKGMHVWEQPTEAQIKARMIARRNAYRSVCRCPRDEDDYYRPFAPVFDPYACEADDCHGHTSEMNPFGATRSVHEPSAEVSVKCTQCSYRTSVWHVDDGSAEEELYRHVVRVHEAGDQ